MDDSVYHKIKEENFTPNAELEQSICSGTNSPAILIPAFLNILRGSKKAVGFGWMWLAETRNNYQHPWYNSKDCESFMKELVNNLKQYAPQGYYFGIKEGTETDYGYWKLENINLQ